MEEKKDQSSDNKPVDVDEETMQGLPVPGSSQDSEENKEQDSKTDKPAINLPKHPFAMAGPLIKQSCISIMPRQNASGSSKKRQNLQFGHSYLGETPYKKPKLFERPTSRIGLLAKKTTTPSGPRPKYQHLFSKSAYDPMLYAGKTNNPPSATLKVDESKYKKMDETDSELSSDED